MDETLIRGDINELQCILDFQKRGFYCSIPFSGSCRYDVVVDINSQLYRIQCKCSSYIEEEGILSMSGTRQTTNTIKTTRHKYSKDEIDYASNDTIDFDEIDYFYTSWKNYSFLIPVEEVSTNKYLRIKKPKNGIQESMSLASDYLLDNVIESIINKEPIKKYRDNRIISIQDGIEKLWTSDELKNEFTERQIHYIKERIMKDGMAYNKKWKYKEFPTL